MRGWAVQPEWYHMTPEPEWLTDAKLNTPNAQWVVAWENGHWSGPYPKTEAIRIALRSHEESRSD